MSGTKPFGTNINDGVPPPMMSPSTSLSHGKDLSSQTPSPSILRAKENRGGGSRFRKIFKPNRRISCKDLGPGDCEGWLYKKKESHRIDSKFVKRWVVLKNNTLYYYISQDDQKAEGAIYLPGFQISPASEVHTKKFAFKAHNFGTTFYFASDRLQDMKKWMNKMGLSAIVFNPETEADCHTESEEENHEDDFVKITNSIKREKVKLDGEDVKTSRIKRITKVEMLDIPNPQELEKLKKLNSLQRTLKAKESEFTAIELLLEQTSIDSSIIQSFKRDHPEVFNSLQEEVSKNQSITSAMSGD